MNSTWKQPIFTQLDFEFFSKKPNDYRVEAVAGREARPQRPVREEIKLDHQGKVGATVEAMKLEQPVAKAEAPVESAPKRMGRPPKNEN